MKHHVLPLLLTASSLSPITHAILPTAIVEINNNIQLLASQSSFGRLPPAYDERLNLRWTVTLSPDDNALLCDDTADNDTAVNVAAATSSSSSTGYDNDKSGVVMVAPRGQCSFQRKALTAQKYGAVALIVYGTLHSRYGYNDTTDTVIYPAEFHDYDCTLGSAYIPKEEYESKLDFEGGYNEAVNDGYLTGDTDGNLCVKYNENGGGNGDMSTMCSSNKCLVTGKNKTEHDGMTYYQACCAWDLHVWLYGDSTMKDEQQVVIPSVYITMEEADLLLDMIHGASDTSDALSLKVYQRYVPKYNWSAVLIWGLGVFVAWVASYMSSGEYRRVWKRIMLRRTLNTTGDGGGGRTSAAAGRTPPRTNSSSVVSNQERGVYRVPEEQNESTNIVSATTTNRTSSNNKIIMEVAESCWFLYLVVFQSLVA
eukprot:scaffold9646_cov36-Cyclotella_meneghiniana.AAC.2